MLFLSKIIYWGLEVKNKTANSKTNNKCEKKSQIKVIRLKTKNKIKKHLTNDKTQQWIWKQNNQSETTMTIEVFGFIWTVTCKCLYGKTMLWWNHYRRINAKNNNTWLKEIGKARTALQQPLPSLSVFTFTTQVRNQSIHQSMLFYTFPILSNSGGTKYDPRGFEESISPPLPSAPKTFATTPGGVKKALAGNGVACIKYRSPCMAYPPM